MRKPILLLATATMALGLITLSGCQPKVIDEYTKDGKLSVSARNLYFSGYSGGDSYLNWLEKEFKIKFQFKDYQWAKWTTQVNSSVQGLTIDNISLQLYSIILL